MSSETSKTNATTTTRRDVTTAARRLGASVSVRRDRDNLVNEVLIDAPAGHVFASSGVHQLVCAGSDGESLDALYADALERLAMGTTPCDDVACDVCRPAQSCPEPGCTVKVARYNFPDGVLRCAKHAKAAARRVQQ